MPKRQKIYRAPHHLTGVFPGIVILVGMLFVGAATYVAPGAYGLYATGGIDSYLASMVNAQAKYHAQTGSYTNDMTALGKANGGSVAAPVGINGSLLSVCADGWVAYAVAVGQKGGAYVTNVDSTPGSIEDTTFPSCVNAAELNKTTLGYNVTVTGIKVARSTGTGAIPDGTVAKSREGASVTWDQKNTCSASQQPVYTVKFTNNADTKDTHAVTSTKTGVSVAGVQNGVAYTVSVAGRCGTDYPAGKATTVMFAQSIPKSSGLLVRYVQRSNTMSLLYGKVSSSTDVHYEIQYSTGGAWHTLTKDMTGDEMSLKIAGYTPAYGTQYRIRGAGVDDKIVGNWSVPRTVQLRTSSVYGYGY